MFKDLVLKTRSYRRFHQAQTVEMETLRELVDLARLSASGANLQEFETEYNQYLKKTYNLISLFTDMMFLWIGLAVVVVVGFILQYQKRRKYYKEWEDQEKYQSSDFDYGDPDNPEQIDDDDEPWRS